MKVSDFRFDLPGELIAQYPTKNRSDSRLMHLDAATGRIAHYTFKELPDLLSSDDLMVFNNTRVIPARFSGHKDTGGRVEILLERILGDNEALVQIRASKTPKPGGGITIDRGGPTVTVLEKTGDFYRVSFPEPGIAAISADHGHMPLPPYIDREDESLDKDRYQTVYATREGAVAAPTAGLHFDNALLKRLAEKGISRKEVTLHVGAGTFQPVRVDNVEDHVMHAEYIDVPKDVCEAVDQCQEKGGRVVAVGTTSVRCLETAVSDSGIGQYQGDTSIFIYPGYEFKVVDAMVTNFHLPESTLLMLVAAFAGLDNIKRAYGTAISESYRFFSYGDAMLITRS